MNFLSKAWNVTYETKEKEKKKGTIACTVCYPTDIPQEILVFTMSEMARDSGFQQSLHVSNDIAILHYKPEKHTLIWRDFLKERFTLENEKKLCWWEYNSLDLSNCDFDSCELLFQLETDLSTIRSLNLAEIIPIQEGNPKRDANTFLHNFFVKCRTLRSLTRIDVANTNITAQTLRLWKDRTTNDFTGPLVRKQDRISATTGWHIADLHIQNADKTPIMFETSLTERIELQRPGDGGFETVYENEGFQTDSVTVAHLCLVLD